MAKAFSPLPLARGFSGANDRLRHSGTTWPQVAAICYLEAAQDRMGMILISLPLFNAILIIPLPLLMIAWYETNRKPIEFSILTLSAVLLNLAGIRSVKLALLGMDYSSRLSVTIELNMFIAIVLGIHLGIKRRWIAMVAALILGFAWLLIGAINAAV